MSWTTYNKSEKGRNKSREVMLRYHANGGTEVARINAPKNLKHYDKKKWSKDSSERRKKFIEDRPDLFKEFCRKGGSSRKRKEYLKTEKAMNTLRKASFASFLANPSKPQIKLYDQVKTIYPLAELNYPCKQYFVDIAIPDLKIAIEYDEPYWHQDKRKDEIRQQEIEKCGWKFLRFCKLPTGDELSNSLAELTS